MGHKKTVARLDDGMIVVETTDLVHALAARAAAASRGLRAEIRSPRNAAYEVEVRP
jgi:hypothetical protein